MFLIQAHWAMLVLAAMAAGVVVVTVCIMRRRTDVALAKIADEFITKYALLDNRRGTERQQILEETAAEIGRVSKQCGAVTDAHAAFINGRYANIVELIRQAIPHIVLLAGLREGQPDGRWAAKWLYTLNCIGVWEPTDTQVRLVAMGQALMRLGPLRVYEQLGGLTKQQIALVSLMDGIARPAAEPVHGCSCDAPHAPASNTVPAGTNL